MEEFNKKLHSPRENGYSDRSSNAPIDSINAFHEETNMPPSLTPKKPHSSAESSSSFSSSTDSTRHATEHEHLPMERVSKSRKSRSQRIFEKSSTLMSSFTGKRSASTSFTFTNHSSHHVPQADKDIASRQKKDLPTNSYHNAALTKIIETNSGNRMLSVNSLHRMLLSDANGITTSGTDDVTVMLQDMLHVNNMIGPTSRRYSLKSCSSISEGDLDMEGNALDVEFIGGISTDSMTMLKSLGDAPASQELDTVAALRVEEFLSTEVSLSDRKKWEDIQQFNKKDLIVGKHLGKGAFSDVFEVFATVLDEAMPTFESLGSDREELDKLIAAKFPPMGRKVDDLDKDFRSPYLLSDRDKETYGMFGSDIPIGASKSIREVDFDPPNQGKVEAKSTEFRPQSLIINNGGEREASEQPNQGNAAAKMKEFLPQRLRVDSGRQRGARGAFARRPTNLGGSVCLGEITRPNLFQKRQERKVVLAMKCLRPQIRSNAEQFMIGVEDLVRETTMLASLNHPNIIKIHGRAGGCYSRSTRLGDGYFILLDRLQDTLTDRILRWKKQNNKSPMLAQINTACSIADAVAYLHSKNIIFRDLKPANVGFDSTGVLKLFDLGFATLLDYPTKSQSLCSGSSCGTQEPGLLYDRCGTLRYMAPEVGLDLGYSLPSDVYSFGILLWEICALKKPFISVKTAVEFHKVVFEKGVRPKLSKHWSKDLSGIMTKCWSNSACERPDMWLVRQGLLALANEPSIQKSNSDVNLCWSVINRRSTG